MCTGENQFENVEDLVQDGIIILYLQQHNVAQAMHEGRLLSMARRRKTEKQLKLLKQSHGKLVLHTCIHVCLLSFLSNA